MKIAALRPRRKHLTAVITDSADEPFLVDTGLAEERLREGMELTDGELEELLRLSQERRAYERALYLLGFRNHSEKELKTKLSRLFGKDAADAAVCRVKELGLVNDTNYARAKAADLVNLRGFAKSRVRNELAMKGIDRETADAVLDEMDTDPEEQIGAIMDKRFSPLPRDEKGKRRMMNYLLSRGYAWGDIRRVLESRGEETED